MLDFGALPPEINSTRMYSGPGSGPMMAAAAAWGDIAAQWESVASAYSTTISTLQGQHWSGPASDAMAVAATRYMAWATATAGQAEHTAAQIRAVAGAYETAFAATVPPAAVAANRAQLATLVATNFFGQNTVAIAATEAVYAEMWAQDAAAMYGYAAAAGQASALTRFQQPPETTNLGGEAGQQPQILTAAPAQPPPASLAQAAPPASLPIIAQVAAFGPTLGVLGVAQQVVFTTGSQGIFGMAILNSQDPVAKGEVPPSPGVIVDARGATSTAAPTGVLASAGKAVPVGKLSVPQNWVTAAQATGAADSAAGTLRTAAPGAASNSPRSIAGSPPMGVMGPLGRAAPGSGGNRVFRMRDRRFRMPRPPAAG